jgi:glutaminyl-tRNA synthetase
VPAEVRLYDHLFRSPYPGSDGREIFEDVNAESETVLPRCFIEPSLADLPVGETVQFERLGYFCVDPDSAPDAPVFNRTLTLRDTWAKLQKQGRHDTA